MSLSFLYRVKKNTNSKKILFLSLPIYCKKQAPDYTKYSYLFSLFQKKKYLYKKEYFLFKVKVYSKFNLEKFLNLKINQIVAQQAAASQLVAQHIVQAEKTVEIKTEARIKTLIQCQALHKNTFGPYKDAFKGKKVVLIASGPTAQFYTSQKGFIYVGVNNSCLLKNVKLDYLFCQDFYMSEEKKKAIVNYRRGLCKKFFGRIPDIRFDKCIHSECAKHVRRVPQYLISKAEASEYYIQDEYVNSFALDIEKEPLVPCGIVFSAMQFILHAHPKEIYLVGCDCSSGFFYKSDITFNANYQIITWKRIKEHMESLYPDIKMFSINPVGLRGLFEDIYTENYLDHYADDAKLNTEKGDKK